MSSLPIPMRSSVPACLCATPQLYREDEVVPEPSTPSFLRPAFLTAIMAAVGSLALAALFVLAARGSADLSFAGFARAAARTWLVSLGSGLDADGVSLGLVPIGATLAVRRGGRGNRRLGRRRPGRAPGIRGDDRGSGGRARRHRLGGVQCG